MRRIAKTALSWFVWCLGQLIGLFALVKAGQAWVPHGPSSDATERWGYVGLWLFAAVFLVASIAALGHRRRAGIFVFALAPVVCFCLAYSTSPYPATTADGNTLFYLPYVSRALLFWALFFLPLLGPLALLRQKKVAAAAFLISATIAGFAFWLSPWTWPLLKGLSVLAAFLFLFGGFWLGTWKLGWPPLRNARPRTIRQRVASIAIVAFVLLTADVVATVSLAIAQSSTNGPDCGKRSLFDRSVFPGQAVFTARVVRSGHAKRESGRWVGEWAIAEVQEQFWGLRSGLMHYVLLTNNIFWEGETYFVDGSREDGAVTRFLPIVATGICTRTQPAANAAVELRVLHETNTTSGARIVGLVSDEREQRIFAGTLTPPAPPKPLAGARVHLTGSTGTTQTLIADKDGIYEAEAVVPDDYILRLELPDAVTANEEGVRKDVLQRNELFEQSFAVVWNGTVGGKVAEPNGRPADAWILLQHSDGRDTGLGRNLVETNKDGSYRLERIPPGTYKLTINPFGPLEGSPYAPVYYPAGERKEEGGLLKLDAGQHVKNVDAVVSRLGARKLKARVTWPDGKPARDAWVYEAYENTKGFESLRDATDFRHTNQNGEAELTIFGEARVRVFAEEIVDDKKSVGSPRYSAVLELNPARMPEKIDLVVSFMELRKPEQRN